MKPEELQYQITQLHFDNQSAYSTRGRIRAIMNGGPDGIMAKTTALGASAGAVMALLFVLLVAVMS